jgi:uncharacterized protein (TIGR02996 family)
MTDAPALLAAIRAAPDDDAPRLVYADWLDEHGQPERAEFIRVQCELARRKSPALRRREAELLVRHHDAFAGPLAAAHLRFRFDRGFPIAFGHTGVFGSRKKSRAGTLLRFFPDGRSMRAFVNGAPVRIAAYFDNDSPNLSRGNYRLSAVESPASIELRFADSQKVAFRGVMEGSSLIMAFGKKEKLPYLRESYSHVHIHDFHSLPEA